MQFCLFISQCMHILWIRAVLCALLHQTNCAFLDPPEQFPFHLITRLHSVFIGCFYLKLLFVVCCTAFKVHVCLFTHGALLREFELAPSPVEEEDFRTPSTQSDSRQSITHRVPGTNRLPHRLDSTPDWLTRVMCGIFFVFVLLQLLFHCCLT